jgi:predicted nucleotidyltransferase
LIFFRSDVEETERKLRAGYPMTSISGWELEIDQYRQTAQRRLTFLERERQQRVAKAWALARKAADLLRERFAAKRVAAFGSLIHPEYFHGRSDVDLAVWGLEEGDYLRAVAAVTALDREISVDLIAVEEAPESLSDLIRAEGSSL